MFWRIPSAGAPELGHQPVGTVQRRCVVWLALAALFVFAGCGGSESAPTYSIEITSDRSLIFTEPGQQSIVSANVLDESGNLVEDAVVGWTSSSPSDATVDDVGNVTSMSSLGSAVLTAEYKGAENIVTAVNVRLRPETVVVLTEDVISVSEDRKSIVLRHNATTDGLMVGSVVVNGNANGFLSRVVSIESGNDDITLVVTDAAITDAVLDMELLAKGPEVLFEEEFDVEASDSTNKSIVGRSNRALQNITPVCKLETTAVNIKLNAFKVTPAVRVQPQYVYSIRNGLVEHFEAAFLGVVEIRAVLGSFEIAGGIKGKITCQEKLMSIPIFPVPIFGPFVLTGALTPAIGTKLEAQYAARELKLNGISVSKGAIFRAGFGFRPFLGFYLLGDATTIGDDVTFVKAETTQENTFRAKLEPFVGINLGIGAFVGPLELDVVDAISVKAFGGSELSIQTPLDYDDAKYTGPKWNVYAGIKADVDPLIKNIRALGRVLDFIGLNDLDSLIGIESKIFEVKTPLLESPTVTLRAMATSVAPGQTVELTATTERAEQDSLVVAWAFPPTSGGGRNVASGKIDGQQRARFGWSLSSEDEGTYLLSGLLFDDIFGDIDLPYASESQQRVKVQCEGSSCGLSVDPDTDPPDNDNACLEFDSELGIYRLMPGASYSGNYYSITRTENEDGEYREDRETGLEVSVYSCEGGGACTWRTTGESRISWTLVRRSGMDFVTDTGDDVLVEYTNEVGHALVRASRFGDSLCDTDVGEGATASYGGGSYTYTFTGENMGSGSNATTRNITRTISMGGCAILIPSLPPHPAADFYCCEDGLAGGLCVD